MVKSFRSERVAPFCGSHTTSQYLQSLWQEYNVTINKKEITFDIYQRASEKPVLRISKNLHPKSKSEKFYIMDANGYKIKKSENLSMLINKIEWSGLKLVK